MTHPFDAAVLMTAAQQKEGLSDWGPLPFAEPLAVLADDYARAPLNALGVHIPRSGLVHSLRMRLRVQEWIRRHPETTDEVISSPVVVVGMMRSGTTLLQRLLPPTARPTSGFPTTRSPTHSASTTGVFAPRSPRRGGDE